MFRGDRPISDPSLVARLESLSIKPGSLRRDATDDAVLLVESDGNAGDVLYQTEFGALVGEAPDGDEVPSAP